MPHLRGTYFGNPRCLSHLRSTTPEVGGFAQQRMALCHGIAHRGDGLGPLVGQALAARRVVGIPFGRAFCYGYAVSRRSDVAGSPGDSLLTADRPYYYAYPFPVADGDPRAYGDAHSCANANGYSDAL